MVANNYLDKLNPPQRDAVEHFKGPILVLAGAGSGKTRVLTHRIVHLVQHHGVHPREILAVTFTNKATEEMRERLKGLLGDRAKELWVSTFHSAALRILRRHAHRLSYTNDFVVYDDDDSKSLMKSLLKDMGVDDKRYPASMFLSVIDQAKNAFVSPNEFRKNPKNYSLTIQGDVFERYQSELLKANAMDFGDLLVNAVRVLEGDPVVLRSYQEMLSFILVDEFQDTNTVQYRFIRHLIGNKKNVLVVGDDDQSIYAFRGATIQNILGFEEDFPGTKVIKLEQNYRSTGNILAAAQAVIQVNKDRKSKTLWTEEGAGSPISTFAGLDEDEEAMFVASEIKRHLDASRTGSDIAVFYRTNAQSRALEESLMAFGIPYRIYGGLKFYDRKEIKDILAYLRLLVNPKDNQAFLRVVNTPPRGIGAQSISSVIQHAAKNEQPLLEAAESMRSNSKGLHQFLTLLGSAREKSESLPLGDLISFIIDESGYRKRLEGAKDPTSESRLENLKELESIGRGMELVSQTNKEALQGFLDRVTLTSSAELPVEESHDAKDSNPPRVVSLMTLHLAKGLEFPVVFLTGMEEGLLPHHRSLSDKIMIEEERRLCYVGLTRAREKLTITRARKRGMFSSGGGDSGIGYYREASRFCLDIPPAILENIGDDFFSEKWADLEDDWSFDNDLYEDEFEERKPKTKKQHKNLTELVVSADSLNKDEY